MGKEQKQHRNSKRKRMGALLIVLAMLVSGCSGPKAESSAPDSAASALESQVSSSEESSAAVSASLSEASESQAVEETGAPRIQDDLYGAVNAQWLADSVIPPDQPTDNPMFTLEKEVTQTLIRDFQGMIQAQELPEGNLGKFLKLYQMQMDSSTRESLGAAPILPLLERIESISDMDGFNQMQYEFTLHGYELPYALGVGPDMEDSTVNVLNGGSPGLFLYSKDYYEPESYAQLSPVYGSFMEQMLLAVGKTPEEAAEILEQAMAYDALLAEYALTMQEQSDYANLFSNVSIEEFAAYSSHIDLNGLVTQLLGETPDRVQLVNQRHFEALDTLVNPEMLPQIKSWMVCKLINAYAAHLTDELDVLSRQYGAALSGVTEVLDEETRNYYAVSQIFSPVVGQYYGQQYFGEEARAEATEITMQIIDLYREKLQENDWLSAATREKAVTKLDAIQVCIGYPDDHEIDAFYQEVQIDPGKNLIENLDEVTLQSMKYSFGQYGKPHNKDLWITSGDTVNAFYSPTNNSVTFTAAILQDPFYRADASTSEKYGAFGAVVGHELSHAFDPNGALFDEHGNRADWWMPEDYTAFEERTQLVFDQFDGVPYGEGTVDAELTNSENVADNAGLKASFDALNRLAEEVDHEEFFRSWARVWRMTATPEYEAQLLLMDTHAPGPLRVNIPVSNFPEFYELFKVEESDEMFRPEEERIFVW